eukprot:1391363-Amphidinium_carterae.2
MIALELFNRDRTIHRRMHLIIIQSILGSAHRTCTPITCKCVSIGQFLIVHQRSLRCDLMRLAVRGNQYNDKTVG